MILVDELDDFARAELAIAMIADKRGRAFRKLFHETKRQPPDADSIERMKIELGILHDEQHAVYMGDVEAQKAVIRGYRREQS